MMRINILLAVILLITGCGGNVRHSLGLGKTAPDEFMVLSSPPLVIPPDFELKPPSDDAAYAGYADTPATKGESSLLKKAGTSRSDSGIRNLLKQESVKKEKKKGFLDRIIDPIKNLSSSDDDEIAEKPVKKVVRKKKRLKSKGFLDGVLDPIANMLGGSDDKKDEEEYVIVEEEVVVEKQPAKKKDLKSKGFLDPLLDPISNMLGGSDDEDKK